jgi:hypothetical protein
MAFSQFYATVNQVFQYVGQLSTYHQNTNCPSLSEPSSLSQKDWQVLASQPLNAPLRLSSLTCDPISSRIIDDTDAERYFDL